MLPRQYSDHDVAAFFSLLNHKRRSEQEALRRLDHYLSTRFNVFDLLRPNEVLLSTVLAELLDPSGRHGQGSRFLHAFMQRLAREDLARLQPRRVAVEAPTRYLAHSTRRFDVLLEYDSFGFVIENKPWAADQERQVSDYLDELRTVYGDAHCLVYLTPHGSAPPATSIPPMDLCRNQELGNLVLMSFRDDIRGWLEACIAHCASDKFRWFLRDLLAYIELTFPGTPDLEDSHAAR